MAKNAPAGWDVTVAAGNLRETRWERFIQDACQWAHKKAFQLTEQSNYGEKVIITITEREK